MSRLFALIDLQRDFIDGALPAEGGRDALEEAKRLLEKERADGTKIAFTCDIHGEEYPDTQEGKRLPVLHCQRGSAGAELAEGISCEGARVFEKSAFASVALARYAKRGKFTQIALAGVCTDICVIANALLIKAYCPEAEMIVYGRACAGTTRERHEAALAVMRSCQIEII